ncbi:hypothetical protein H4582DRAFT_1590149 [Lactarius indigo]|nr:hypothetical protein H4582DRAFT_1590149 [Lactarius indigo]
MHSSPTFSHMGGPSAYPPDRRRTVLSPSLLVAWNDVSLDKDKYVCDSVRDLSASISKAGIEDGQDLRCGALNQLCAIWDAPRETPLEKMYGKNMKRLRLRKIKKRNGPFVLWIS